MYSANTYSVVGKSGVYNWRTIIADADEVGIA